MSELWHKTLVYLGLVEEPEEYQEHQVRAIEDERAGAGQTRQGRQGGQTRQGLPGHEPQPEREDPANVRHLRSPDERQTHVRLADREASRVTIVRVVSFDDAEQVGQRFRSGNPVLLDLGDADNRTGRRLLDFVGGVIFALRGRIVPAGERAFLLMHEGAELAREERRRLEDLGYPVDDLPRAR